MWQVLALNGPCGVGKSTIGAAISDRLGERVPHALIELDALSWVYPRAADDPYGTKVALQQLQVMRPVLEARGVFAAICPSVYEAQGDLDDLAAALPGALVTHIRLEAPVSTLNQRLSGREWGASLDWHQDRAGVLAAQLGATAPPADLVLATEGQSPDDLAQRVLDQTGWPR